MLVKENVLEKEVNGVFCEASKRIISNQKLEGRYIGNVLIDETVAFEIIKLGALKFRELYISSTAKKINFNSNKKGLRYIGDFIINEEVELEIIKLGSLKYKDLYL